MDLSLHWIRLTMLYILLVKVKMKSRNSFPMARRRLFSALN
jgi:hypothetical protein